MADYHSPTVVQQTIPSTDMTPLARLLLTHIFDSEEDEDGLYFHAALGPSDSIELPLDALRAAFAAAPETENTAHDYIGERLEQVAPDDTHIELDLSGTSWEFIFQDIVRRSATLDHVTIVSAFTCTKMRPDGFGGMAVLITADAIKGKSTHEILEDFLAEEEREGDARPNGRHVLLVLDEPSVRDEVRIVIESDEALAGRLADAVTDDDIHAACIRIADRVDFSEELGAARFRAAYAAIRLAERRRSAI